MTPPFDRPDPTSVDCIISTLTWKFFMDVFVKKVQSRPINGKHSLVRKLGEGGHGGVYLGADSPSHLI